MSALKNPIEGILRFVIFITSILFFVWGEYSLQFLFALLIVIWDIVFSYNSKNDSFDARYFIYYFSSLYILSPAFSIYFFGTDKDEIVVSNLLFHGIVFLYFWGVILRNTYPIIFEIAKTQNKVFLRVVMMFLLFIFIVSTISKFGFDLFNLSRSTIYTEKGLDIAFLKIFLVVTSALLIMRKAERLDLLLIFFFLSVELLVYGDRRYALSIILLYFLSSAMPKNTSFYFLGTIGLFAMYLLGMFRNFPITEWFLILKSNNFIALFDISRSEFGQNYFIYSTIGEINYLSSFTAFVSYVFILPSRFVDLVSPSHLFAKEYFPDIYAAGGAFGYSLFLESVQNFHFFGPAFLALYFFLITRIGYTLFGIHFIPIMLIVFPFFARFDFAGLHKTLLVFSVPYLLVYFLSRITISKRMNS